MNKEEKLLIKILNAYIGNESIVLDKDVDYELFYKIVRSHNLSATVYAVVKNSNKDVIEDRILSGLENSFYDAIMRYNEQSAVMFELDELLCAEKIEHIYFKGAKLREYYPIPELREMSDIDLLIHEKDRAAVKALLEKNGFETLCCNGPVYNYRKSNVVIEMHSKIIHGKVGNANAELGFADAMENAVFEGYKGEFAPEYHFAYLITHIAHHFWFYGAGIKLILDLAIMLKCFDLDFDKLFEKTDEIGLTEFAENILSVCKKWFGYGKEYVSDTEKTENFLLNYGAFGNANRNNSAVVMRKEYEENKKANSLSTRIHLLFPNYSKMKNLPYMKFMEGHPYLLIFGWIYRIYYNIKHKQNFIKDINSRLDSDESKKEALEELDYFKEIGLL